MTNEEIVKILLAHGAIKPGTDRPWGPDELTPQKIVDLVGIRERRWVAESVNTSDLALVAAERALADAGIGWPDVGILTVGSSTPEAFSPSTACMTLNKAVQGEIASGRLTEKDARTARRIPAFDVSAACTSGLYAIDLVRKHLLFGETEARFGLGLGAEVLSRLLDFSDTNADLWGTPRRRSSWNARTARPASSASRPGTGHAQRRCRLQPGPRHPHPRIPGPAEHPHQGPRHPEIRPADHPRAHPPDLGESQPHPRGGPGITGSRTSTCSSATRPTPGSSSSLPRSWASRSRSSTSTSTAAATARRPRSCWPCAKPSRRGRLKKGDLALLLELRRRADLGVHARRVVAARRGSPPDVRTGLIG
ncbi:MAG: hypothetical protein MZV70_52690 [Desulfobacterales bacterium]|nr:hypothetical protein [Desulfobacterales bacterium]